MSAALKKPNLTLVWGDIPDWAYSSVAAVLETLKQSDPATFEHCLRVGEFSRLLAKSAGLTEYQQKISEFAGILHDVGKVGVGRDIVHKPGKLTESEYEIMKQHSIYSEEIIQPLATHEFFRQVLPAVRGHHERVDGLGYPDKLHGEDVPLISRMILIVDTYDAMGQDRSYRKGLPVEVIYKELEKFAGTQFDKALVTTFMDCHESWKTEKADPNTINFIHKKVRAA